MATYDDWIVKSERIGASLGAVSGFFFGAFLMATNPALGWADLWDILGSTVAVLIFAIVISSLCIVIGWLAGLLLGILASPLTSFTEKHQWPGAEGPPKAPQKKAA